MITSYAVRGDFLEACDCFELCPCWVDEEPDEGHCTGLVAWRIRDGSTIGTGDGDVVVGGARVAAVTAHTGGKRRASALTVLYVDDSATGWQNLGLLAAAFSGTEERRGARQPIPGSLGALAKVTGTVLGTPRPARIEITGESGEPWTLAIGAAADTDALEEPAVHASGGPKSFPDGGDPQPEPLTLTGTALHAELRIRGRAEAQRTAELSMVVPALPGGYLQVTGRSGMRGEFAYMYGGDRA
ncbi:hypothetical protein GCM10009609_33740 [Pseudonocardia aurantiaca]|uniref:DUF1326 domain-containing protein n=1 Tax=Pseudonocardia aurantiaca TaxID=75290 RepID=A0ABW4FQK4_9PSEU